jgi:urate oxidase
MLDGPISEEVREILRSVYTPHGVEIWLDSPNRNLWDTAPVDLIKDGHGEEVLREARRVARS